MKVLFWVGMVVVILGITSLFVPIPHNEREGVKLGPVSVGVETRREERVSPIVSAVLIIGGAGMMIAAKVRA